MLHSHCRDHRRNGRTISVGTSRRIGHVRPAIDFGQDYNYHMRLSWRRGMPLRHYGVLLLAAGEEERGRVGHNRMDRQRLIRLDMCVPI